MPLVLAKWYLPAYDFNTGYIHFSIHVYNIGYIEETLSMILILAT